MSDPRLLPFSRATTRKPSFSKWAVSCDRVIGSSSMISNVDIAVQDSSQVANWVRNMDAFMPYWCLCRIRPRQHQDAAPASVRSRRRATRGAGMHRHFLQASFR